GPAPGRTRPSPSPGSRDVVEHRSLSVPRASLPAALADPCPRRHGCRRNGRSKASLPPLGLCGCPEGEAEESRAWESYPGEAARVCWARPRVRASPVASTRVFGRIPLGVQRVPKPGENFVYVRQVDPREREVFHRQAGNPDKTCGSDARPRLI